MHYASFYYLQWNENKNLVDMESHRLPEGRNSKIENFTMLSYERVEVHWILGRNWKLDVDACISVRVGVTGQHIMGGVS